MKKGKLTMSLFLYFHCIKWEFYLVTAVILKLFLIKFFHYVNADAAYLVTYTLYQKKMLKIQK